MHVAFRFAIVLKQVDFGTGDRLPITIDANDGEPFNFRRFSIHFGCRLGIRSLRLGCQRNERQSH